MKTLKGTILEYKLKVPIRNSASTICRIRRTNRENPIEKFGLYMMKEDFFTLTTIFNGARNVVSDRYSNVAIEFIQKRKACNRNVNWKIF